jgi:hypothetical protein
MASYFIDLDGVFFRHGTMQPNEGAVQSVRFLMENAQQVFFVTKRKPRTGENEDLCIEKTTEALGNLEVPYTDILHSVESPRVLVNDEGAFAIEHERDTAFLLAKPLDPDGERELDWFLSCKDPSRLTASDRRRKKMFDILATIAWVAWKYPIPDDADDYVQTMLVARSLCERGALTTPISSAGFGPRHICTSRGNH